MMTAADFPPVETRWGSIEERERRRRISISVLAYAYEIVDNPIIDDFSWDWAAGRIQPEIMTGHPLLDEFFRFEYSRMTAMWIHLHPELDKIALIYDRFQHIVRPTWKERIRNA
jgi:hypothetical protein